jgi:pimeloyl-ACP methyl ester carboxylesterase
MRKSLHFITIFSIILSSFTATAQTDSTHTDTTFTETTLVLHTPSGEIAGTLTLPKQTGKIPVALIIAGSGPTDRNGDNPMMKNESLQKLAYGLAGKNIASLRFDKRGIGQSRDAGKKEADLRFEDYINDAKSWIELLKKDARFSKVIVAGHSEGSLIGMVAALHQAHGFISIAGAGKSADKILKEQLAKQPPAIKDPSIPIIDSLVMGKTVVNVPAMLNPLFRPSVQPYMISWFHYDPPTEIKKLAIPILIIQGTNDLQITVNDANLLAQANTHAQLVLIKNMNHVFRIVEGDRKENLATYITPANPISEELVNTVAAFINKS